MQSVLFEYIWWISLSFSRFYKMNLRLGETLENLKIHVLSLQCSVLSPFKSFKLVQFRVSVQFTSQTTWKRRPTAAITQNWNRRREGVRKWSFKSQLTGWAKCKNDFAKTLDQLTVADKWVAMPFHTFSAYYFPQAIWLEISVTQELYWNTGLRHICIWIQPNSTLYFTEKLIQKLKGVAFHPIRKGGKKEYPSRLVNTKHVLRQRAFKTSLKNPIFRFDQASKKQISLCFITLHEKKIM